MTAEYFEVLGVRADSGRLFSQRRRSLDRQRRDQRRLAARLFGDGTAIGQRIVADGRPLEIIGVTADGFNGVRMDGGDELFVMLPFLRVDAAGQRSARRWRARSSWSARLAPGATLETARAEMLGRWPGDSA